jgi:1-acyl-sn-glycerol-3-phosphate acyltransferase
MNGNPIYATCSSLCRLVGTVFFGLKVYDMHHVPRTGGCLIVANHQSFLDPPMIGCRLPRPTSYFAKSELFDNKFFGNFLRKLYAFPVRQGEGDIGAVREAIRRLQEGHALVLFPEGSRSPTGDLQPLSPGVGLIVKKARVPVIPAVIDGSFKAWPRGQKLPNTGNVHVQFGPPMHVADLKAHGIVHEIDKTIHEMFTALRARFIASPGTLPSPGTPGEGQGGGF